MRCLAFRECAKNTLVGFASVEFDSGIIINDITLHSKGESQWASPPSKPQMDGTAARVDDRGKIKYVPIIEFRDQPTRDRWSIGVVSCVNAYRKIP